jgi:hypothetical protein
MPFSGQSADFDVYTTGAATSAGSNNILNVVAGPGGIDTTAIAVGRKMRSALVQVVPSAALSAGAITFAGSNDNATWTPVDAIDVDYAWTGLSYQAIPFLGATVRTFRVPLDYRYVRLFTSVAFVGGTVTALTAWSTLPVTVRAAGGMPALGRVQNTVVNSASLMVTPNAPANLRSFLCGVSANSGGAAQLTDLWISNSAQNGPHAGSISMSATQGESDEWWAPSPVPSPLAGRWEIYNNGGATNLWMTMWWFIAP